MSRLWPQSKDESPATRSRWQRTRVGDDGLFQEYSRQLGLVGTWWSGPEHRGRLGINGLRLIVMVEDSQFVVPVGFVVRRPDPIQLGWPCRDKLTWLQVMLDRTWAALQRRCLWLLAPTVVADSWFGDSGLMVRVAAGLRGTPMVGGKASDVSPLAGARRVKRQYLLSGDDGPWHDSAQPPEVRYVRPPATSPMNGTVTVAFVDEPGQDRYSLPSHATSFTAPRLIRAWRRRSWIEHHFRILKHLVPTEAAQVQGEDSSYGHFILWLVAGFALLSTGRIILRSEVTMQEILFSLKHYWRPMIHHHLIYK